MYDHAFSRCEQRGCQSFHRFYSVKLQSVTQTSCLKVMKGSSFSQVFGLSFRGSSFAFSLLLTSFQSVFCSSLYCLLTLVFARYSSFYFTLFLFSIVFSSLCSAYSSPYQTPFRVFLDSLHTFKVLSLSGRSLSLSFSPYFQSIFTRDPFSTNLNHDNFFRLEKL